MVQLVALAQIAPETVEAVLDAAFGADRKGRTAYRMRAGVAAIPGLSFALVNDEGRCLGTIQSWPLALEEADGTLHSMTLVGPIAVLPEAQGLGFGQMLTKASVTAADQGLSDALVMIGDPEYYGRFFGFSAEATGYWEVPGPVERHRLLARLTRDRSVPRHGRLIPDPAFASRAVNA